MKFLKTHTIIIGGDLNVDFTKDNTNSVRDRKIRELINDYKLKYDCTGKTFVNHGIECSEIDYFLIQEQMHCDCTSKEIISDLIKNVSVVQSK